MPSTYKGDPYADTGGADWMLPPATSAAPASTGGNGAGFLQGLMGGASGLLSALNPAATLANLAGPVAEALKDAPINQTGTAKQTGAFSFANPFQVGGKGNALTSSPATSAAPAESAMPGGTSLSGGINANTWVIVAGAILAVLILAFGLRRK